MLEIYLKDLYVLKLWKELSFMQKPNSIIDISNKF